MLTIAPSPLRKKLSGLSLCPGTRAPCSARFNESLTPSGWRIRNGGSRLQIQPVNATA